MKEEEREGSEGAEERGFPRLFSRTADGRTDRGWTDALEAVAAAAETQTRRRYIACLPFVSQGEEANDSEECGLAAGPPSGYKWRPQLWSGFRFILFVHAPFP